MPARLLTGKEPAADILESLKPDVKRLDPCLVIVQVGSDPLSAKYIKKKLESAASIGMRAVHKELPEKIGKKELMKEIQKLNEDEGVTGFIVQLPLPEALWEVSDELFRVIDPRKDVDGFTGTNLGNLFVSKDAEYFPPATPAGVIAMLDFYKIDVAGKNAVVIGRSNLVGKPLAAMLLNRSATVAVCHSKTSNLAEHVKQADIIVAAVGKMNLVTREMIKPGAVIIDIGMTHSDGVIVGDVDSDAAKELASAVTPVPGGVGPMTVACLLRNVVRAAELQAKKS